MKKLLIVDDDELVRQLVTSTLDSDRVQILEAADGDAALKIARREKPGLIFLDVRLPDVDGFEICRILKTDPTTKDTTIVMLTAMSRPVDREEGIRSGANDYFVKPFSPLALLQKVDEILGT